MKIFITQSIDIVHKCQLLLLIFKKFNAINISHFEKKNGQLSPAVKVELPVTNYALESYKQGAPGSTFRPLGGMTKLVFSSGFSSVEFDLNLSCDLRPR